MTQPAPKASIAFRWFSVLYTGAFALGVGGLIYLFVANWRTS